jgi:hypothetical protein
MRGAGVPISFQSSRALGRMSPGGVAAARRAAADAERYCLVTQALRVPVRLHVDVRVLP